MALEPITNELATIESSRYGSEMRMAIHDALEKLEDNQELIEDPVEYNTTSLTATGAWGTCTSKFVNVGYMVFVDFDATIDSIDTLTNPIYADLGELPEWARTNTSAIVTIGDPVMAHVYMDDDNHLYFATFAAYGQTMPQGSYHDTGCYPHGYFRIFN